MSVKKQKKKYKKRISTFMKLLIFCFVIVIPVLIFIITFRLENVIVEGNTHYTSEELQKKVITKKTDGNTLLFYLRNKYSKLDSIPFVEDIEIELINKNSIKIHVYEKVITGCIEFMGGYMYFDKDGVVVESSDIKLEEVPFVTGLKFNKIILYEKLEIEKDILFEVVLNLTQLIQKFELKVDTISFNSDLEVTLSCDDLIVLLGKRETYDEQIAELKNLLPNAKGSKLILDMKKFKEGQDKIIAKPQE